MVFEQFRKLPITDSHEHIERRDTAENIVENFRQILSYFGYERILILGIHDLLEHSGRVDPTNSMMALYVKKKLSPKVYAFAGLQHFQDERDTPQGYLRQVQTAWEIGFDGIKLFEMKPGMRRKIGYALDGAMYAPMFDYLENTRIPITMHLSDPADFWGTNPNNIEYLRSRGWLCDETYPTRHQLFAEVDSVMQRHPKLRLTVAHLMCDEEDVRQATRFLSLYPNTAYDMTACASEYAIASREPAAWREFFLKFSDRLYFGTDQYNVAFESDGSLNAWGRTSALLSRTYLESREDFTFNGEQYTSLRLPQDVTERIYSRNFVSRLGEMPRAIDAERAREECRRILAQIESGAFGERLCGHAELDAENLRKLCHEFL